MIERSAIAVIDIGKTNAKLVIWDHDGQKILFETSQENRSIEGPPYRHLDTGGLWHFYLNALRQAVAKVAPILIGKVITTTHGATIAVLNGDKLALPIPDYENTYESSINHAYDAIRDAFEDSQSPCLPAGLNFGRQIFALEENFPREMREATDFLPYPQYWAWQLSGVKATEVTSLGCHSDLWHPGHRDWSHLAKARGWNRKFPAMRAANDILGFIRPEIARQTGLPENCAIYCGVHDSNASLVPLIRQITPPFSLVSSGTWTICFSMGSTLRPTLREDRDTLCNVDVNGQAVPSARFMGGREYAHLSQGHNDNPGIDTIEHLIKNDCFAIPSFADAGGPFIGNAGIIIHKEAIERPQHNAALATMYVALMTDYCLEMIQSQGPVIIEGPFAANTMLCKLIASFRPNQSVRTTADSAGTSFGAALLTMKLQTENTRALHPVECNSLTGLRSYHQKWRQLVSAIKLTED